MTALPAIFNPEPGDNEDVASALETADIFWTKGDTEEALRWLKRAAETASDAGNDMRALAIARSVADLKSDTSATVAAPAAEPSSVRKSRPPPPSSVAKQPPPAPSSLAAASDAAARAHNSVAPQKAPPPLPPSKARESVLPEPHPVPTRSAAPVPTAASTPAPAAEVPVRRAGSPSTLPKEPQSAATPATAYRAITVFVKPQGRNGNRLEVIVAKPGQHVPAGAEPALLIPTRRGGRLLG
jgi:hypothetical protein